MSSLMENWLLLSCLTIIIIHFLSLSSSSDPAIASATANVSRLTKNDNNNEEVKAKPLKTTTDHVPSIGREYKNDLITTESLMFLSTLDGTLFAVSKSSGKIIWRLKENPVLNIPGNSEKGPVFFANPKDGSLYSFRMGLDGLKELSFTIPDLVSLSPCKSTDGTLYTGSKADTWFAVDPLTGVKVQTLNMDGSQQVCPSGSVPTVFIGRTEYKVVMFDHETRQPRWNATYMDYSSHAAPNLKDYELQHFASSSGGIVATMDQENGEVLWTNDFMSPVVAMYTLNQDQGFQKVPFLTFAKETLYHLTGQMTSTEWRTKFLEHGKQETRFYQTLFIGEHENNLYALPSFVDTNTVSVTPKNFGPLLLEGPQSTSTNSVEVVDAVNDDLIISTPRISENNLIVLGYHDVPDISSGKLYHPRVRLIADKSVVVIPPLAENDTAVDGEVIRSRPLPEKSMEYNVTPANGFPVEYSGHVDLKFLMALIFGLTFAAAFFISMIQKGKHSLKSSVHLEMDHSLRTHPEITDGVCVVGKISFSLDKVLGHGCGGTEVFQGHFDGREVAVKRLLSNRFNLADREAALLRESDQHQNVIRYYCTEHDANFRYIAFEMCMATVYDYVVKKDFDRTCMTPKSLIQQMMSGLAHLHSISIVHRDIKPQNVLLSQPDQHGKVRAMISDFGLCKKLSFGRQSLSKVSGAIGTFGWMAPEFDDPLKKVTCAVDIFSAGCVMYYVVSNGEHPFGDQFHQQANILNGDHNLSKLSSKVSESNLAKDLVKKMISFQPSDRPTAEGVVKHPFFWSFDQQLRFLEAVSNRLEKVPETEPIVIRLEAGGLHVIKSDWMRYITEDLRQDLRKFRSYKCYTVRDLLRAIRNKHHHFSELGPDLQKSLGQIPDEYLQYFTTRFPALVLHVYDAMSCFCSESCLSSFY